MIRSTGKAGFPWLQIVLIILLIGGAGCANEDEGRPNVLLILTDDQGWGDLALHGNELINTPNLDQLGKESTRFTRFYVSPVCAPTRASLLTGRYHLRTGTSWVTHRKEVMRNEEVTLAEVLKAEGYQTGIFGKWHNGEQYPHNPQGQGFDEFVGFSSGHWNNYFDTQLEINGRFEKTTGYITDVLTNAARDFMIENREEPFFCYVPLNAPHGPFQVPDSYFDKYKNQGLGEKTAAVYGMVENIDDNVGRLLSTLDSLDIKDNTIVIFLTDNGPNGRRYNGGMKGIKGRVDEGGVRVPFFMRWPGSIEANREVATISSHIDVLPTLADLLNIELSDALDLDGISLAPLMSDNPDWKERNIYTHQVRQQLAMTPGSVRNDRYRLVLRNDSTLLYDMLADPYQRINIADSLSETADQLRSDYHQWFEEVTKDISGPPDIEVGHEGYDVIRLPGHEASLSGGLKFQGGMGWANDYIINWTNAGEAQWLVNFLEDLKIAVTVWHTNCKSSVGSTVTVQVGEDLPSVVLSEPFRPEFMVSPDRIPRIEVYEKEWKPVRIGELTVKKGENSVSLRINGDHKPEDIDVKMIQLEVLGKPKPD